jgi:hypothetical protein
MSASTRAPSLFSSAQNMIVLGFQNQCMELAIDRSVAASTMACRMASFTSICGLRNSHAAFCRWLIGTPAIVMDAVWLCRGREIAS